LGWGVKVKWQAEGAMLHILKVGYKNLLHKVQYENVQRIKVGPMMWMSYIMDGNRQEGKQLIIKCNELRQIMPLPKDHLNEFSC